uniref:UTRA domain-containing protein n=1 Tax=Rhodococcus qingshengii TaxID=334542 RepID=UPI00211A0FE0
VPSRKVVTFERMSADDGLATELGIEPGDSVVHLERVLFADGETVARPGVRPARSATALPARLAPGDGGLPRRNQPLAGDHSAQFRLM